MTVQLPPWAAGVALTLAGNGGLLLLLLAATAPDKPSPAEQVEAAFDIDSYPVEQSAAEEHTPDADDAASESTAGLRASGASVPVSMAKASEPEVAHVAAAETAGQRLGDPGQSAGGARISAVAAPGARADAAALPVHSALAPSLPTARLPAAETATGFSDAQAVPAAALAGVLAPDAALPTVAAAAALPVASEVPAANASGQSVEAALASAGTNQIAAGAVTAQTVSASLALQDAAILPTIQGQRVASQAPGQTEVAARPPVAEPVAAGRVAGAAPALPAPAPDRPPVLSARAQGDRLTAIEAGGAPMQPAATPADRASSLAADSSSATPVALPAAEIGAPQPLPLGVAEAIAAAPDRVASAAIEADAAATAPPSAETLAPLGQAFETVGASVSPADRVAVLEATAPAAPAATDTRGDRVQSARLPAPAKTAALAVLPNETPAPVATPTHGRPVASVVPASQAVASDATEGSPVAPGALDRLAAAAPSLPPPAGRPEAAEKPALPVAFAVAPAAPPVATRQPQEADVPSVPPPTSDVAAETGPGLDVGAAALDAPRAEERTTAGLDRPAPALETPTERQTAVLAWTGGGQSDIDAISLAAIQSFAEAGDPAPGAPRVRDRIGALLAAVPCARLQTVFDPDTGQLLLRGHVPEAGLRTPVLAALGDQVGGAIPLRDDTIVLPRPVCGVLADLDEVGLTQSDEQEGDPRVVGQKPFAAIERFVEGERLEFSLQGPDYPAYFYVDFFDAAGQVLHLQPNALVPPRKIAAKVTEAIGLNEDGAPAIDITVTAPFGREVLAAFAATEPLYDGVRPTVEPAAAYLEFLREAVARARDANPDFRGEWFYFISETVPD